MSAPSGAGKSLAFEVAPYAFDAIVFVVVPLISLMKYLVSSLNCRRIRASYVGDNISINWCLEVPSRFPTTIDTFFVEWNTKF